MHNNNSRLFLASLIALLAVFTMFGNGGLPFSSLGTPSLDIGFAKHKNDVGPNHYTLQFRTVDGESLTEPLYYDAVAERFGLDNVLAGERLINQIGIAYFADDETVLDALVSQFEQTYLVGLDSAEYDLIFLVFNPVERYNWDSNVAEQMVASFQYASAISQVNQ